MQHRWALGVASAVAVALTLGVLVGVLIHLRQQVQAAPVVVSTGSSVADPPASSDFSPGPISFAEDPTSSPSVSEPAPSSAVLPVQGPTSIPSPSPPPRPSPAPRPSPRPTPAPITTTTTTTPTTTSTRSTTQTTSSRPPAPTPPRTTSQSTTTPFTPSSPSTTSTTSDPSSPAGSCPVFGARTQIGAVTAYCQHDPKSGALRWREVTDGGGCLARNLHGVGVDGRRYACRLFPDGLERWVALR